jgi:hypothetical protein
MITVSGMVFGCAREMPTASGWTVEDKVVDFDWMRASDSPRGHCKTGCT